MTTTRRQAKRLPRDPTESRLPKQKQRRDAEMRADAAAEQLAVALRPHPVHPHAHHPQEKGGDVTAAEGAGETTVATIATVAEEEAVTAGMKVGTQT